MSSVIEFQITKQVITSLSNVIGIGEEYIDIVACGNTCTISAQGKGLIFAEEIPLAVPATDTNIRVSSQVLRQLTSRYSLARFFVGDSDIDLFLFKQDLSQRPVKISMRKSIGNLASYYDLVKRVFETENYGKGSLFAKCCSALNYITSSIKGLPAKDYMITNGVLMIDLPQLKFFANLGVEKLDIVIPEPILKQLFKAERSDKEFQNLGYELYAGYHIIKTGTSMFAWRAIRSMPVNEYKQLKSMVPYATYFVSSEDAADVIKNIKVADNREQTCYIDFEDNIIQVDENDIISYVLPIYADRKTCSLEPTRASTIANPIVTSPFKVQVHLKSFIDVAKTIGDKQYIACLHHKVLCAQIVHTVEAFGEIELNYALKLVKSGR